MDCNANQYRSCTGANQYAYSHVREYSNANCYTFGNGVSLANRFPHRNFATAECNTNQHTSCNTNANGITCLNTYTHRHYYALSHRDCNAYSHRNTTNQNTDNAPKQHPDADEYTHARWLLHSHLYANHLANLTNLVYEAAPHSPGPVLPSTDVFIRPDHV